MTKNEFKSEINKAKLGGRTIVDSKGYCGTPNFTGCFYNGETWNVYENDERGLHEDILNTKSEGEAFQFLYDYLVGMSLNGVE